MHPDRELGERERERERERPCYNDWGKKEATTKTTDTIFIYCYVCLCFIMSRWKERREEEQKETDERELHSNEGMPGAVGWGRKKGEGG